MRLLALLVLLAACGASTSPAAAPDAAPRRRCKDVPSLDECERTPGCVGIRVNPGPTYEGPLWHCEER